MQPQPNAEIQKIQNEMFKTFAIIGEYTDTAQRINMDIQNLHSKITYLRSELMREEQKIQKQPQVNTELVDIKP